MRRGLVWRKEQKGIVMKKILRIFNGRVGAVYLGLSFVCVLASAAVAAESVITNKPADATADATVAWKDVQKACRPPMPPAEWQGHPTQEQIQEFRASQGKVAGEAADKAKDFYTRFPTDEHAKDARKKQLEMLQIAAQLGNTDKVAELDKLNAERLADPSLPEDERVRLRVQAIQRKVRAKSSEGKEAALAEQEKGARELIKDFPERGEGYQFLMSFASMSDDSKGREVAKEILASKAPKEVKKMAEGMLAKLDALGKPLDIKFTSVDGREVDLSKMSGKVVLVDFWATWCPPCVAEIPHVKEAYEKLHPKGFEIVGISFDSDKSKLEKFVAKEEMKWPQYYDGKQWQNEYGQKYGIQSIPTMWLVDKKGKLNSMNARDDLQGKVEKLLAE